MSIVDLPPASSPAFGTASSVHSAAGRPALCAYQRHFKRVLDVSLILASIPVALPVIAVCAALVALDGHAPLYMQRRIGRHGKVFRIVKLRSMVPDAEAALAAHVAENVDARAEWDSFQKLRNDPRITPIGRLLRKTSLDELPQLWNVLLGHMSLVGPRPMMECQKPLYPGTAYFLMRPGITGLWQISARNQSEFADRSRFDAEYWRGLTFGSDLRILWRTAGVVLRRTGC